MVKFMFCVFHSFLKIDLIAHLRIPVEFLTCEEARMFQGMTLSLFKNIFFIYWFERERNINLLFHLLMHSLVDFCMCPDWGLNLQPWCIGMML